MGALIGLTNSDVMTDRIYFEEKWLRAFETVEMKVVKRVDLMDIWSLVVVTMMAVVKVVLSAGRMIYYSVDVWGE